MPRVKPEPKTVPISTPLDAFKPVKIDWREYFKLFCLQHGQWPIYDEGRLLFPDGWSYAADDYAGPEWSPPKSISLLAELQVRYWRRRKEIVKAERDKLEHHLKGLAQMQRERPIPLQRSWAAYDEDGRVSRSSGEIDWAMLAERLRWLTQDVIDCENNLKELGALV